MDHDNNDDEDECLLLLIIIIISKMVHVVYVHALITDTALYLRLDAKLVF